VRNGIHPMQLGNIRQASMTRTPRRCDHGPLDCQTPPGPTRLERPYKSFTTHPPYTIDLSSAYKVCDEALSVHELTPLGTKPNQSATSPAPAESSGLSGPEVYFHDKSRIGGCSCSRSPSDPERKSRLRNYWESSRVTSWPGSCVPPCAPMSYCHTRPGALGRRP
jgi:hypothetical protein